MQNRTALAGLVGGLSMFGLVATGLASTQAARPVATTQESAEQDIMRLERDWCTASMKKDATLLAGILSDDYTGVSSRSSKPNSKAEDLADLKGSDSLDVCVDRNIKVRVYGNTAVATGQGTRGGTYKSVPFKDRQILWTDIFVLRNGRWQCVASHGSLVAAPQ